MYASICVSICYIRTYINLDIEEETHFIYVYVCLCVCLCIRVFQMSRYMHVVVARNYQSGKCAAS